MKKIRRRNAFYAQSGGVTAVINASACGVIEACRKNKKHIGKLFAGQHSLIWDGLSKDGRSLPTGIYIISLNTTNRITNKKVLFLK